MHYNPWIYGCIHTPDPKVLNHCVVALIQALISTETATIVHRALNEALLFMVVFSVPLSYVIAMIGHCCYGGVDEADQEMSKVDKIYAEVYPKLSHGPLKSALG